MLISNGILLTSCIHQSPSKVVKQERIYYLKQGDVAPIEGWLITPELYYDIISDALKHRTSSTD